MTKPPRPPGKLKPSKDPLFMPWFPDWEDAGIVVDVGPRGVRVRSLTRRKS